jgi:hypothetical protein
LGSIAEGLTLHCHPDTPAKSATSVSVDAARNEYGQIVLRYALRGDIAQIRVPAPVRYSSRVDNLWITTCFEAFLRVEKAGRYLELNAAPSTGWATYAFNSYRTPTDTDLLIDAPPIDVEAGDDVLELTVAFDVSEVAMLGPNETWELGLSAVIEETDGTKSYWALRHPPGKPDFHHPDCFVLQLAAPDLT